jgi:asparagine synthase (glutamine-hydrolysing)
MFWGPDRRRADAAVRAMTAALVHRGPDDEGIDVIPAPFGHVAFGQRRLAIQDLSAAGHQPMTDPATGNWVNYNGEIYNYPALRDELAAGGVTFRSRCDTEVILHAYAKWGTAAFSRLHGMFAVTFFDAVTNRLILARDQLGIKPLYYAWGPKGLAAASEIRSVLTAGVVEPAIDRSALAGFFAYGAVQGPRTMIRGVTLLDPGTVAEIPLTPSGFESQSLRTTTYWRIPVPDPDGPPARTPPAADVRRLLRDAVRSHLLSDVPVGVFLSSGLDSTAIALLCREAGAEGINTFTVGLADGALDESGVAARTAERIGAVHHEVRLTDDEVRRLTLSWLGCLDQPSIDGLNTYIISHAVRRHGIKVALSGLGGDELFGGYSSFRDVPRMARVANVTRWVPRRVRQTATRLLYRTGNRHQRRKAFEMAGDRAGVANLYFRRRRLMSDGEMRELGFDHRQLGLDDLYLSNAADSIPGDLDSVSLIGVLESQYYMGNMLLRDADVFGMAHGLEIRVPFLHLPLCQYAFQMPGDMRVSASRSGKYLVREALADVMPAELLTLRKRGFSLSQEDWMRGPLREEFDHRINVVRQSGVIRTEGVDSVWKEFETSPAGTTWSHAWAIAVLGSWIETWNSISRHRENR